MKIVEVLGRDIPMELFDETKKIESEGGMLILVRIECVHMHRLTNLFKELLLFSFTFRMDKGDVHRAVCFCFS